MSTQKTRYVDEDLIQSFLDMGWDQALAGDIAKYAIRAGNGISLKHNLYKIRWIANRWIEHLEKQDTKG